MFEAQRAPLIAAYSKKEYRAFLRKELLEYEKSIKDMTEQERRDLHEWVRAGNRAVDNPYCLYDADGWPMDYVSAVRAEEDMLACMARFDPVYYMDEENPAGIDDGLPF